MSFAYVTPRDKPPVNVPALKGGEFLRFLLEGGEGELAICVRCGGGVSFFDSLPDGYTCTWCDGPMMPVGPTWWESMARRVRQVLKRDPTLLRKIKADWGAVTEGAPLPRLGPWFAWLNDVWKSVGYPPGRRFERSVHFERAVVAAQLQHQGHSIREIANEMNKEGGYPVLPPELWRSIQWARRQWTDPMARLRGERVKS